MNRDSGVKDSESNHKCQKSIFYTLIDNVMLTERKRRNSEVQCLDSRRRAHNKTHGMCRECLYSQTTHGWNSLRHLFTPSSSRTAWRLLLAVGCGVECAASRLTCDTCNYRYFCQSALRSNGYLKPPFPAAYIVIKLNPSRCETVHCQTAHTVCWKAGCLLANVTFQLNCHISLICFNN